MLIDFYFKKHVKEFYGFTINRHIYFKLHLVLVCVDACTIVHVWTLKDDSEDRIQAVRLTHMAGTLPT